MENEITIIEEIINDDNIYLIDKENHIIELKSNSRKRKRKSVKRYNYPKQKKPKIKKLKTLKERQKDRFYRVRKGAKDRNKSFELTFEEFIQFWQKPCYYCGSPMEGIGLDRVDNNKGYLLNNVVPCCRLCNTIKGTMTVSNFIQHIRKIVTIYDHRMLENICNAIKNIPTLINN